VLIDVNGVADPAVVVVSSVVSVVTVEIEPVFSLPENGKLFIMLT